MTSKLSRTWVGVAAVAACGLAGAAVALGAGSATKTTTGTITTGTRPVHTPETPLTGDVLAKVKAAALARTGGTVDSATTESDSSTAAAVYEAHVTKADGSHVTVILDNGYNVLSVETGHGRGGHERGGHGRGGSGEAALTGDTATSAKAAAVAKVGGTAESATTENDSDNAAAAYEVRVTKSDGTHVTVILDKSFSVLSVETHSFGPADRAGHGG